MGPVEFLALAFPGDRPTRPALAELAALRFGGQLRVVDALVVRKDPEGGVGAVESADLPELGEVLDGPEAVALIGPEDVEECAELLRPGWCALLVLVEHRWAHRAETMVREGDGHLLASVRIPPERVAEARAATGGAS